MYSYIRGTVTEVMLDRMTVEACGVGYELLCSNRTLANYKTGDEALIYTHMYLAEGIVALYGFAETEEREMFRKLINVTRVGPKLAVAVLSRMSPSDVQSAVITDNAAAFDSVSGMGRKTAQRVILELKEKIQDTVLTVPAAAAAATVTDFRSEAVAALMALGYDGLSSSKAVTSVKDAENVEELIKKALRSMVK